MKKLLSMLLALAMLTCVLAACGAPEKEPEPKSDEVFELNVSLSFSEGSGKAVKEACDRITEATNGRVKFNMYYSWSLVSVPDAIKGVQGGVADLVIVPAQEYPSLFMRTGSLMALPMIQLPGMLNATEIFMEMYNEHPSMREELEGNGLKLWTVSYTAPQNIHQTGGDAVLTPAGFAGKKTIAATTELQEIIIANGGAPISATGPEYYSTLEKGVADSVVQHLNALGAFGVAPELIETSVIFGDSGLYMTGVLYLFNLELWNSFPADIQEAIMAEADNVRVNQTANDMAMSDSVLAGIEEKGAEVHYLTEEQLAVWSEAFGPIREEKLEQLKELGADDIDALYADLTDKIASREE